MVRALITGAKALGFKKVCVRVFSKPFFVDAAGSEYLRMTLFRAGECKASERE